MKYFFVILLLTALSSCTTDFGNLQQATSLPNYAHEVSGIETSATSPILWLINDSGNEPEVMGYLYKENEIDKIIKLTNVENDDWEDLTTDEEGNLYIGNFGNNNNKRKDLAIYTIAAVDTLTEYAEAKITTFSLEDQKEFPPKNHNLNYDIEAFIFYQDHFYLFTRNRSTNQFDGTTNLYKLPAKEGDFVAKKIGSYKICDDRQVCQVTSADIHPQSKQLVLLTSTAVYRFRNFTNDAFFKGKADSIAIGHYSQKEGIAFKNKDTLYITDELRGTSGGNIYTLPINTEK